MPAIDVAVELDNADHEDWADVRRALSSLSASVERLALRGDVSVELVILAEDEVSADAAVAALEPGLARFPVRVRLLPGVSYFEKKAIAARESRADVVLLPDCDCVYEESWACDLVDAFEDPAVMLVNGITYARLEGASSRQRAAALVWRFPIEWSDDDRHSDRQRHGNNLGVRPALLEKAPMPSFAAWRSQGSEWLREVDTLGAVGRVVTSARSRHRQPEGVLQMVRIGWLDGRDRDAVMRVQGWGMSSRMSRGIPGAVAEFGSFVRRAVRARHPELRSADRVRSAGYAIAYLSARATGQAAAAVR